MEQRTQEHTIDKAFAIMRCLAQANTPLSLKDISGRTGYPKSTAYRVLSSLRLHNAIVQDNDGKYRLGAVLFELGNAVERQWNIKQIAKPYLQQISNQVSESVSVAMLDGDSVLILDSEAAFNQISVMVDVGTRFPLHACALGKAILAYLPKEEAMSALARTGMPMYTPHTIADLGAMRRELESVRERGYAIENGEMRIGMRSAAAPIFDISGAVTYAIAMTGMFRRVTDEDFVKGIALITQAAAEISQKLR